jgi:hypothetical protein
MLLLNSSRAIGNIGHKQYQMTSIKSSEELNCGKNWWGAHFPSTNNTALLILFEVKISSRKSWLPNRREQRRFSLAPYSSRSSFQSLAGHCWRYGFCKYVQDLECTASDCCLDSGFATFPCAALEQASSIIPQTRQVLLQENACLGEPWRPTRAEHCCLSY